jgi:hypothetical protein
LNTFITNQFLPFNILNPVEVIKYLVLTLVYFLLLRLCTRRVQSNEIDAFLVVNVSTAFSMTLLTAYLEKSDIRLSDFISIMFLTASFYLTVLFFSLALRFETLKSTVKELARKTLLEDWLRDPIIFISFILLVPVTLFFASAIQGGGEGSSAGILRGSAGARLIGEGLSPFFTFYALSVVVVSGRFRNWFMLLVIFGAGPLIGSKAAILSAIISYFMIRGLYKREMRFRQAVKLLPLLPVALASMILPLVLFGYSFGSAFVNVGSRFFLSGDTYFWLFVAARPENFYQYYEWATYLLHPFIALFGQRGYDVPLGAALLGHYLNQSTLGGPNPLAPALALVLFKGNLFLGGLFCMLLGVLIVVLRYAALRAFTYIRVPPFLRSLLFIVFFLEAPMMFIDVGTTERIMFSSLIFGALFFLFGIFSELGHNKFGLGGGALRRPECIP